jgi:hypothetical protein
MIGATVDGGDFYLGIYTSFSRDKVGRSKDKDQLTG